MLLFLSERAFPLYHQMVASYSDSISKGTATNRLTQARSYVDFAVRYAFDPLAPSGTELCLYLQFLKDSHQAPTTIKNYLSGAKTWMAEHGGLIRAFSSFEYLQMYSGISKRSQHTPKRASPLTWEHIKIIMEFLQVCPSAPAAAQPCILLGYHTFLRASNLLSPTMTSWGGPHTIMAQDISLSDKGLDVVIKSTKTKNSSSPLITTIPWQQDPLLCPASSWLKYVQMIKPWILGPAFTTDDHRPLTARHLVGIMRLALKNCRDINPSSVSLHSLRRGAAHNAVQIGMPLEEIKERGMWRSNSGLSPYLK